MLKLRVIVRFQCHVVKPPAHTKTKRLITKAWKP